MQTFFGVTRLLANPRFYSAKFRQKLQFVLNVLYLYRVRSHRTKKNIKVAFKNEITLFCFLF